MKAIILAAGYNQRLNKIIDIPKPLIKIGQNTILERQIYALIDAGFNKSDIFVVTGYKSEMIEGVHNNIILNEKYMEYDNAYSVYLALKYILEKIKQDLDEEIFILDGDLVYDQKLIGQILNFKKKNILVNKETIYSEDIRDEISIINDLGEISELIIPEKEKLLNNEHKNKKLFTFLGILKLSLEKAEELKNSLEDEKFWTKWYTLPLPEIVNRGGFYNFSISKDIKFCFDIDTKEDLDKLKKINY